ncbi:MAG: hypothetical protein ABR563_19455 [Pyrinomonadaceae bacterium]
MRIRNTLLLLAAVIFLFVGLIARSGQASARVTWEYKTVFHESMDYLRDKELSDLGAQGWELVAVAAYGDPGTAKGVLYFKRAK